SSWRTSVSCTYSSTAAQVSDPTGEVYQGERPGRKPRGAAERAGMDSASRRARRRERWIQRAERARDAFGLVFVLVLITYTLASLIENHGWTSVVLTIATSATSVVALVSAHARHKFVRATVLLAALTVLLAAIGA